jgi:DNA sulfur modification protein DndC
MTAQSSLFEAQRMTMNEAMALTADSLRAYGERYRHWAVAFSGGKDSSATVTLLAYLIESGQVPAPDSLAVLYADTRMELPPLQIAATGVMDALRARGIDARVVLPELDDRFFVYMFGRGVPPPKNRFRWCTPQLKIEPMLRALKSLRERAGEKLLMLTGVRLGESAARDQRIVMSCSRDGAECGQGWFQETTPEQIADTLAPLLHWRVCHVWDWLNFFAPAEGFPTSIIAESYGGDEAAEVQARTGCVGCNLASRDTALERVLRLPQWEYLRPLMRLRPLYAELTKPHNRLRKGLETKADGTLVSNPGRMGPLTMEAREMGIRAVQEIQHEINEAARAEGRPEYSLINDEELGRIRELIEADTWPNRWDGSEARADEWADKVMPGGFIQPILEALK